MTYKVAIGNGLDSVEAVLTTKEEVVKYLETDATTFKQALKTLAQAHPVVIETKVNPVSGTSETRTEPAQQPAPQGAVPELCPKCGKKSYYTNTVKKEGNNFGKKFHKCSACKYIDWGTCQKGGYSR
jgi:DNA-directed RNA polymerase subunit M/transcription elongation factor TFIIS